MNQNRQQILQCDFCGGNHQNGCCYEEEEAQFISNQNQQRQGNFSNFQQGWRNNPNQGQGWRNAGPPNRPPYQQQWPPFQPQQQNQFVPLHERQSKLEDKLDKFIEASLSHQKHMEATVRNLETQVGQLAKQLSDQQASSNHFSAHTYTNPKEHCKAITTRGGKVVGSDVGKNL